VIIFILFLAQTTELIDFGARSAYSISTTGFYNRSLFFVTCYVHSGHLPQGDKFLIILLLLLLVISYYAFFSLILNTFYSIPDTIFIIPHFSSVFSQFSLWLPLGFSSPPLNLSTSDAERLLLFVSNSVISY